MEDICKKTSKTFEEMWPLLQTAVDRLINQIEGVDYSSFTYEDCMSYFTTVFQLCTARQLSVENCELLYAKYKKVFEEYINSTVLPSLQGKKDELLLTELLRRWSNYKTMTMWLLSFFQYLDRHFIIIRELPSLKETSFLSFYDLVHDKINKQVGDAILAMIDQEHAGVQIDRRLLNNALAVYSEIGDIPRKNNAKHFTKIMIQKLAAFHHDEASNWIEEKLKKLTLSSKKIRLVSSNGDVFEVDYGVALMSKTIEDAIKTKPASGSDSILVCTVSSNILAKVIEYCKKHIEASNPHYKEDISGVDIKDWDAEFVRVDNHTLYDLHLCANYLNIKSLLQLTSTTIGNMVKGKNLVEIHNIFSIKG